jgi:hypothetical protein
MRLQEYARNPHKRKAYVQQPGRLLVGGEPPPKAGARHERTLEAVGCTPLILIEAPSSAYPGGMLRAGDYHA